MSYYRKKPVVIQAKQWDGTVEGATPIIDWVLSFDGTARYHEYLPPRLHSSFCRCDGRGIVPGPGSVIPCPETEPQGPGIPEHIAIETLEGTMVAMPNDWVIRGVKNEAYPCKPDIFEATYERVEGE